MKIKHKLFYIPGAFLILLLLAILIGIFYQVRDNLNSSMLNFQRILVDSSALNIDEYIAKHAGLVTFLQTFDSVKNLSEYEQISVEHKGLSDQQGVKVRTLFKRALKQYPEFAYFATFTKDKAINAIYEPYSEQLDLSEEDYYRGFSHRDWYTGAMKRRSTYISEAYMSASILKPVIAISTPIFVEENIAGIMIGALELTVLSEQLSELNFGRTGHSYIIDKKNQIVAHPDPRYFQKDRLFKLSGSGILEAITRNTNSAIPSGLLKANDPLTGEDVYFSYSQMNKTGWVVITQMSVEELEEPISNLYQTIVLPSTLMIALFLSLAFLVVRRVVVRIELLSQISKSIKDDNLEISDKDRQYLINLPYSKDETYQLLNSFGSMIDRLQHSFRNIDFLASYDQLTELPNRRSFYNHVEEYIKSGASGAIVIFDLDDFKIINDTKGHTFGDQVLIGVASLLRSNLDERFFISRFGGDELLACIKTQDKITIEEAVAELHEKMTTVIEVEGIEVDINCSMGVSIFPEHETDINELVKAADLALFEAKQSGKKQYVYYSLLLQNRIDEEADIENCIKDALANDGFKLCYQPQVNLDNGELIAFEALIRMKSGKYHPGQFIPVAEKYGHISNIGRWTILETIQQLSEWKGEGLKIKPISVNYSAAQFVDKGFLVFVKETLSEYKLLEKYLELEITEGLFVKQMSDVSQLLNAFSKMGIKLSIDDFGTGYSSISYLMTLPVNKVKLDRSLCVNYLNEDDYPIVESIISLIKSFDMLVVAEGVEDKAGVEMLAKLDCDIIQGYYFDKPLDASLARERLLSDYHHLV